MKLKEVPHCLLSIFILLAISNQSFADPYSYPSPIPYSSTFNNDNLLDSNIQNYIYYEEAQEETSAYDTIYS